MTYMTQKQVVSRLREMTVERGGQAELARKVGLSRMFICDVLLGRRAPNDALCAHLGLERITLYRKRK